MPLNALNFQLLGQFLIKVNGLPIPEEQWRSRRARSLVKLLALAPGHRLHRDQILDALWPDSDLTASANNFHQTLFTARKVFESAGSNCLVLQDGFLSFGEGIEVDVDVFEQAAARASNSRQPQDYRAALAVYHGDLLPENLYDEWTLQRRDALRLLHLKLLLDLARIYEDLREYPLGIETLQRVIVADRTHEAAHAALMRLYALSGQRQQALRQYQVLRDLLQAELDAAPDRATEALLAEIQSGRLAGDLPPAPAKGSPQGSLPEGMLTFLFTDIEGSTPLWEKYPAAMRAAVALHHDLLRRAIEQQAGTVFKVVGDQFQAVFRLPGQALGAALEGQRALQNETWPAETGPIRVRMGLHAGLAERAGSDYAVSHTFNRVSRVMSAGYGGQILLTREVADLVSRELPPDAETIDLGEQQLKGLERNEHLYQLNAPGLKNDFPPLPTSLRNHNFPAQLSTFIGREKEIQQVKDQVLNSRLVTLTGSGGTGKTRLALQAAEAVLGSFPNGAFLVELAAIIDPDLIPNACLQTLELISQPGVPPAKVLAGYLEKKHLLLILDNCEHLTPACTRLADELLKSCPRLHILATSREILSIPGETPYRVPSLAVPSRSDLEGDANLASFDAVSLFVERAREAHPGFNLTRENGPAVVEICARLDGIPLAIELAAARTRVMSVDQIAARLDNAFRLLTGGSQAVMPRQQTLRATIDWSYALITPPEKTLLQRLAVFSGGWSLEACEGVCADEDGQDSCAGEAIRETEVLDLLTRLVDRSLVIADVRPGGMRYRMLETIHQYAREKLLESGCGEQARDRHLAYFARLSGEAEPHLRGKDMLVWLDRLELELDNIRAALEWSLAANIELGLKIASDMMWFWHIRALFEEAVAHFEKLLAAEAAGRGARPLEAERALQRARGLRTFATHLNYTNHPLAAQRPSFILESVAILRELGSTACSELGISLNLLYWMQGNLDQPSPLRAEFLEIFERNKNVFYLSEYYNGLHFSAHKMGRLEEAEVLDEKSLAICREIGDLDGIMSRCYNLSFFAWYKGDHARADALLRESLAACRKVKNRWMEPRLRVELSKRALSRGEYPQAARLAEESLLEFRELNYLIGTDETLDTLQCIAWSRGELDESLRIGLERLELYAGQLFSPLTDFQRHNQIGSFLYLGRVAISQGDLGQAERLLRTSAGNIAGNEGWLDYHVEIHQLLAWIAMLSQQKKQPDAARLLGAVDSFYRKIALSFSPRERSEHLENLAAVQTELGAEAFSALFTAGQAMSLAEAIALVNSSQ